MKIRNDITKLIAKHIKNKLNDQQRQELEDWATASEENMHLFLKYTDKAFAGRELKKYQATDINPDQKWNKVLNMRKHKSRGYLRRIRIMKYSAVAAVVVGLIAIYYLGFFKKENALVRIAMIMASSQSHETPTIKLPDGSEIVLNSKSKLRYPEKLDGPIREVYLTGGAFFKINKKYAPDGKPVPFIVNIGGDRIEVTGTQFDVKAYDGESMSTTLIEGSITMTVNGAPYTLRPGERLKKLNDFHKAVVTGTVSTDLVTAWKNGYFQFDNTPLKEALNEIERWYNVKFDPVPQDLELKGITLQQTDKKKSLDNLLRSIGYANDIKLTYKGMK